MWAWNPLSGEGAAIRGARFNPAGVPALYLALSLDGMFAEMGHGFSHILKPLTVCAYAVDMEDIIDLRNAEQRQTARIDIGDMACAWAMDLANGKKPASWRMAENLIAQGAAGILVPSFARGARPDMSNMILWRYGPDLPHRVTVHDPSSLLPRDQSSWLS